MTLNNPKLLVDHTQAVQAILQTTVQRVKADAGILMLFNPSTGGLDIEAFYGSKSICRRLQLHEAEQLARSGRSLRTINGACEIASKAASELAVPLEQEGQIIGLLHVCSKIKNVFSVEDEKKMRLCACDAVEWLKIVWEIDQLRIKARQLESLVNMGQAIVSQDILSNVLKKVARESALLMKAKLSSIMLISEDGAELELAASHNASKFYIRKPNLQVSDSLLGVVARTQRPMVVLNVQKDTRYQHTRLAKKEKLVSLLAVPLIFKEQTLGTLSVYTDRRHRFSDEEIRLLNAMAGLSAVVIAKAQIMEKVARVEEDLKTSEKLSALGWLAAEVAHEIRNPLTVMQMLFHSLAQNLTLDKEAHRDAILIKNKMQQMNRIVERVLAFAKSSEPSFEMIHLNSMMDDLALLIRHKLAEQKIEIKQTLSSDIPPILGDRTQLEQAILNLVLNACHAMPHGGTLTLSAQFKKEKSMVLLTIKDTGEGISPKRQKTLFQSLMSYRKGGLGIGLALVRKIIELHNGKITLKSRIGKGATFQIFLPAIN